MGWPERERSRWGSPYRLLETLDLCVSTVLVLDGDDLADDGGLVRQRHVAQVAFRLGIEGIVQVAGRRQVITFLGEVVWQVDGGRVGGTHEVAHLGRAGDAQVVGRRAGGR